MKVLKIADESQESGIRRHLDASSKSRVTRTEAYAFEVRFFKTLELDEASGLSSGA
jgi:hypothetical protein